LGTGAGEQVDADFEVVRRWKKGEALKEKGRSKLQIPTCTIDNHFKFVNRVVFGGKVSSLTNRPPLVSLWLPCSLFTPNYFFSLRRMISRKVGSGWSQ
jgi:hypothetical protein